MTWDEYVVELDEMHTEIERLRAENDNLPHLLPNIYIQTPV